MELRFLPKTWGFVRYLYGKQQYDTDTGTTTRADNSDFKRSAANVGVSWDAGAGAKLNGELNLGYEWVRYDNQLTPAGSRRGDTNSWTAATSITFMPTETTTLGLSLNRALRNTASDTNENFEDTSIGLNVSQKILSKVALKAGATYGKNEYNIDITTPGGAARSDTNYLGNIGLDYQIQDWLNVGLGYTYNRKDSNVSANEYKDNQVMASIKVVY